MGEAVEAKKEKAPKEKKHFFKNLKAEFKKVIWPDKEEIGKQTFAVILLSVFLGVIIALVDILVQMGAGVLFS